MKSRGRQGVAYGFLESMGFSRASAKASRSARSSSAVSAAGSFLAGAPGLSRVSGVSEEAELREEEAVDGKEMLRLLESSNSWPSRESVRVVLSVERERVLLMRRLNARRSCFFFAGTS